MFIHSVFEVAVLSPDTRTPNNKLDVLEVTLHCYSAQKSINPCTKYSVAVLLVFFFPPFWYEWTQTVISNKVSWINWDDVDLILCPGWRGCLQTHLSVSIGRHTLDALFMLFGYQPQGCIMGNVFSRRLRHLFTRWAVFVHFYVRTQPNLNNTRGGITCQLSMPPVSSLSVNSWYYLSRGHRCLRSIQWCV